MFGKVDEEKKAALRAKMLKAISEQSTVTKRPESDRDSEEEGDAAQDDEKAQKNEGEARRAGEQLKIHAKSESVEISNIRLFDMSDLELDLLTECKVLSLRKNLIHELVPLPLHLANRLVELDFFDNKIKKLRDFFVSAMVTEGESGLLVKQSFPNPFSSLTKLDLSYNQLQKIHGLEVLGPTLKELYLVENKIKVVEGLDSLVNLEVLELGGNRIREIGTGLESLTKLRQLWLGKNKIGEIGTALQKLSSVELISLQANRIIEISAENFKEGCNPHLAELYLSENGISVVQNLPIHSLKLIDFSFNPIATINDSVINAVNMPLLGEFWLTDGKIDKWDEVKKFECFSKTLRTIYVERNPIEQDKRYRDKVYMFLPFVTQIDSWPVVNKENLEADRSIQRRVVQEE